ncbi:F0F1 ATP synthase subunit alpha [Akkermansia sp. N21169]|jgi:F-type H+-transporting ATPase subunit alpha|uniref:F0F1 ATP synthase subunit alpha n=1 Tax=unclassified Akkermansia TaxID=2608915 RepID=UPI00244E8373|nr:MULTISPECIES: F0F1 ATP synthase subunit alpha [unclassified Akkermansia]MDH3068236.1 F0F1 ATP synthase subunit alpha [Akkermansia sp. N21169]WPX40763.1 F0F1 ATP synthase subunit alpha [Akkermansia sp. N21116]
MNSILQELEAEITKASTAINQENVGVIRTVGDGVAKIEGLSNVMLSEMIDFPGGVKGMAMNLEENEVGAIIIGDDSGLKEGDEVKTTGKLLSVPVGRALLGRVVSTLGEPLDGKGPIAAEAWYPVEKIASGIISREPVSVPVQTGILPVDAMIPIGRGQRELIIGDRSTGKTAIALDTMIAQGEQNRKAEAGLLPGHRPLYNIYVAIGQKRSKVKRLITKLEETGTMPYSIIVVASASDPAAMQYLAPYAGCAMGEYFMDQGEDALIVYDDLSKHAVAYRQVSLILRRPSGREAYPGDVFYLHSRLLERAARLNSAHGGGSLTALPIIETQAGDVSAYIPTNVISITDGQIFLETDLFYQGVRPAINVGISVSRVGSAAQTKIIKKLAGSLKLDLAQYTELQAFAQFGSDLDPSTKAKLERGSRIVEVFKQKQYEPMSLGLEAGVLYAMQKGYMDDVPVNRIKEFQIALETDLQDKHEDLLEEINRVKELTEDIDSKLKQAIESFKAIWS